MRLRNLLAIVAVLASLVALGCWDNRQEMARVLDQGYATSAQIVAAQFQRTAPFAIDGWRPRFVEQALSVDLQWQGQDGKTHVFRKVPVSERFERSIVNGEQVKLIAVPVKALDDDTSVPVLTLDAAARLRIAQGVARRIERPGAGRLARRCRDDAVATAHAGTVCEAGGGATAGRASGTAHPGRADGLRRRRLPDLQRRGTRRALRRRRQERRGDGRDHRRGGATLHGPAGMAGRAGRGAPFWPSPGQRGVSGTRSPGTESSKSTKPGYGCTSTTAWAGRRSSTTRRANAGKRRRCWPAGSCCCWWERAAFCPPGASCGGADRVEKAFENELHLR